MFEKYWKNDMKIIRGFECEPLLIEEFFKVNS